MQSTDIQRVMQGLCRLSGVFRLILKHGQKDPGSACLEVGDMLIIAVSKLLDTKDKVDDISDLGPGLVIRVECFLNISYLSIVNIRLVGLIALCKFDDCV